MTYIATDASGAQTRVPFDIDILGTAESNLLPDVRNLRVARTRFATSSAPAIDVTFDAPNLSDGLVVEQYELSYLRKGHGPVASGILLDKDNRSYTITGLIAGESYRVHARARFTDRGWNPNWAVSPDIKANRPPQQGSKSLADAELIRGPLATYSIPMGQWPRYFTDPNGDTLTPSVQPEYPGLMKALASTTADYAIRVEGLNPGTSKLTYGAYDGYGGFVSGVVTYTIVDNPTRVIMENSPAGTLAGAFLGTSEFAEVAGTPYGDEALTHTLHGEAASYFDIATSTGLITLKQGASLDYEAKNSYTGQVRWTVPGQGGQQSAANLTINVADMETGKPDAPTVMRAEFSEPTNPALDVTWTAPQSPADPYDAKDPATWYEVQYRKKAAEGEAPADWTAYSEKVLQRKDTSLRLSDLEPGATYEVQVRAGGNREGSENGRTPAQARPTRGRPPTALPSAAAHSRSGASSITTRQGSPQ